MSDDSSSPELTVLGTGLIHGIFLASGIDVETTIAKTLNSMFDTLFSWIPPERQEIFPLFWIKLLVWFMIVIVPSIKTIVAVRELGRVGVVLFISGFLLGYAIVVFV